MECAEIREMLPAYVRDGEASLLVKRHLSRCDDCAAELGRYETLVGGLAALRGAVVEPPPDLRQALLAIPRAATPVDTVRAHVAANRKAYLGGAVALAGAGALAWRLYSRRVAVA